MASLFDSPCIAAHFAVSAVKVSSWSAGLSSILDIETRALSTSRQCYSVQRRNMMLLLCHSSAAFRRLLKDLFFHDSNIIWINCRRKNQSALQTCPKYEVILNIANIIDLLTTYTSCSEKKTSPLFLLHNSEKNLNKFFIANIAKRMMIVYCLFAKYSLLAAMQIVHQ